MDPSPPSHPPVAASCPACGTQVAPTLLACPSCHRLVHAETLAQLAAEAEASEARGDVPAARGTWERMLALLPEGTRQSTAVRARLVALPLTPTASATLPPLPALPRSGPMPAEDGPTANTTPRPGATITPDAPLPADDRARKRKSPVGAVLATLGVVAALLFKFKFVAAFLLTKAKLLVTGLTKAGTLFSMLASIGVYWAAWGWQFALGLVLSIYVHEMGHVAAIKRLGMKASMPMFIPGLGAFIRLQQRIEDPRQDARVGLAGPIWGLGAALASWGLALATGMQIFAAIAKVGAWINLFNLLPVWQLDGSRAFHALSRTQRGLAVTTLVIAWVLSHEGLLLLVAIVGVIRLFERRELNVSDWRTFFEFAGLTAALTALTQLPVRVD